MTTRRALLECSLAMAGGLVLNGCATPAAPVRRRLIGHTGITWGYSADNAPDAIRDVGALGFHGFESFGNVLEAWQSRGGLQAALDAAHLPLIGAYCPMLLVDPQKRDEQVRLAQRWGRLISNYGGGIAVIGPDNVDRQRFEFAAHRSDILAALNDIALALADVGVTAALHQHSGSCITTRDETWAVMEAANTRYLKLCPDTGELLSAGIDPLAVIRHFGEIIAHVHVKDYDGGAHHDGYTAVGAGKVDTQAIMNALEKLPGHFMVMAELNPDAVANRADPAAPRRLAAQSRAAFESLGYRFRA